MLDQGDCLWRTCENYEPPRRADDCLGPRPAAAGVIEHLDLVDHAHVDSAVQI